MTQGKPHRHLGETIYPCERVRGEHQGRWIVQGYHKTGAPYADELCPHYTTLADAKEAIRDAKAYGLEQDNGIYHRDVVALGLRGWRSSWR